MAATVGEFSNLFASLAPEFGALTAALGTIKTAVVQVLTAIQGVQIGITTTAIKVLAEIMAQDFFPTCPCPLP